MVERKNKYIGLMVCLISMYILGLTFSGTALAKSKKVRLNVGFGSEEVMESLQTGTFAINEMGAVYWPLVYDQLWVMGPPPNYDPTPWLATRWETDDHKTWRFYLQKNVKFHDGTPLTAEDVAFTLWNLPKDPQWSFPSTNISSKKDIKVIDKYTVEFTLANIWPGKYPPVDWMPILPKHVWKDAGRKIGNFSDKKSIGSGPFKLKQFKSGEFVWMVKNEKYWGEKPQVDEVVFKGYGSADALKLAMKKGEIEFTGASGFTPLSVKSYQRDKNINVAISPGLMLIWITFNLHKETVLKNKTVRKALLHGIDRERIYKMVYLGYAQPADSFVYPESPEYNPNLPKLEYNPGLAKKMLNDAGYFDTDGDGILNDSKTGQNIELDFMVPSEWADEVKMVKLIKEQVKEIGITINEKVLDLDTYYEFVYQPTEDKFDLAISSEEPGPNGSWMWEFVRSRAAGGVGWNQSDYASQEMDDLLSKYLIETELDKRNEYVFKMQELLAEDLPCAVIARPNFIGPYRTDKFEGHVEAMGGVSNWINWWTYMKLKPKK
ncbi:MAG: peptide ABC transporter substrate-binding protein [Desulfobacteraceae bacterium]|nr:peptide ABC transporter substrate-binding protein [Desulfobacteraceae bacterium]